MYCDFACFTAITHFVANCVKFCKNAMLGVFPIYYSITYLGGVFSGQFITILHEGETPKLYYVIYEQPLTVTRPFPDAAFSCTDPQPPGSFPRSREAAWADHSGDNRLDSFRPKPQHRSRVL